MELKCVCKGVQGREISKKREVSSVIEDDLSEMICRKKQAKWRIFVLLELAFEFREIIICG
jgi:hypothetical protein